jgi:hypothetical protein
MSSGQSMDASVLMQKLVEKDINTKLLIEFYEEVADNERVFSEMVEDISRKSEIEERQKSVEHIENFCLLLRDLQNSYEEALGVEKRFATDAAKREDMIHNASRFLDFLEKECDLQFPDFS